MPIKYPEVMNLKTEGVPYAWSDREVMLYALGIGMGEDPLNEKELLFVNEGYYHQEALEGRADLRVGVHLGRQSRARSTSIA